MPVRRLAPSPPPPPSIDALWKQRLELAWFERTAVAVARGLIGCALVHRGKAGMIVEAEAYVGPRELRVPLLRRARDVQRRRRAGWIRQRGADKGDRAAGRIGGGRERRTRAGEGHARARAGSIAYRRGARRAGAFHREAPSAAADRGRACL